MTRNKFPVTRRQALAVSVGATIGSFTLPREWFLSSPERIPQSATGSWPMERHDPARTGYAPESNGLTRKPNVSWQATIADKDEIISHLVCSDKAVYATSNDTLYAFTAATGSQRWQTSQFGTLPWTESSFRRTENSLQVRNGPTLGNKQLFVGSRNHLAAVDLTDGSAQWGRRTSGTSTILRVGNTVYINNGDTAVAIDLQSGLERWKTSPTVGVYPYAYADGFIVGPAGGSDPSPVAAINASTGKREWTTPIKIESPVSSIPTHRPNPCIVNGAIYYGSGPLYALTLTDGTVRWSHSIGATGVSLTPVSDGSAVYFVLDDSVRAIDAESGKLRWRVDLPALETPALIDGTLYVGLEHGIAALDSATGDEQFRVTLSETETVSSSPIIAGGTVYLALGQTLYALTDK